MNNMLAYMPKRNGQLRHSKNGPYLRQLGHGPSVGKQEGGDSEDSRKRVRITALNPNTPLRVGWRWYMKRP